MCTTCKAWKPASAFGRHAAYAGGLRSTCTECRRADDRQNTARSAQIVEQVALKAEGKRRCWVCNEVKPRDREHFVVRGSGGFDNCLDCNRKQSRARHAANPEPSRKRACQWAKDNPEAVRRRGRIAASRRRARLREAFVEDVDPQVVFERDEGICGICGTPVERDAFDVDHVVPLAQGGEHSYRNVRVAHPSCNRSRPRSVVAVVEGGE